MDQTEGAGHIFFDVGSIVGTVASSIAFTALTAGAGGALVATGIAARFAIREAAGIAAGAAKRIAAAAFEKLGARLGLRAEQGVARAEKTFQTYTKVNPTTGEVYSGRTSGVGTPLENIARRDASHAYNAQGFGPASLDRSGSAAAIRGREQQLIEHFRGLGQSANRINGIGPRNPRLQSYLSSALNEFGMVH